MEGAPRARSIAFAWELGGGTGHVATLHPLALALKIRGHAVRFLQKDLAAGADLEGTHEIPREPAPVWIGPPTHANALNFAEILHNFGYHDRLALLALVDAWRERLRGAHGVIASVAPAAHIAARTLGIPSFEISQGFHVPPPTLPSPPFREWEPAPTARLYSADERVVDAINSVLDAHRAARISTIGDLFFGRSMLLTYPELDIYPERGPAEYFGIPHAAEGTAVPPWPEGEGPRVLAYLYGYYANLGGLVDALERSGARVLAFVRGAPAAISERCRTGRVIFTEEPMAVSHMLPQCDVVLCHASHQMTSQALLAGKPLLLAPTQLEQFIIMRRVVRQGAGLGLAPGEQNPDVTAALRELLDDPRFLRHARAFSERYRSHDRAASLQTMVRKIEEALAA
jgi:UDP:flavonoid glycosyltransferase YjiC (YdhE family)